MAQPEGPQDGPARPPSRPSLMGGAAVAPSSPHAQLSVLAALDGKPPVAAARAPGGRARWLIALGGMAVVALGVAWTLQDAGPAAPLSVAAAPAAIAPAPVLPASAVAVTQAASAAAPAASALALVEDLPVAAAAAAPASAASAASLLAAATTEAPRAASAERHRGKNGHNAGESRTKDKATRQAKTAAKPTLLAAKPATPTTRPGAPATTSRANAASTAPSGDADVDLIAAIVQHMSRDTAHGGETTIADLVARCKSLPAADGQRCMRRICDNYWGRAEACPRSAAPNEVAIRP